jgi:hypothetical protein
MAAFVSRNDPALPAPCARNLPVKLSFCLQDRNRKVVLTMYQRICRFYVGFTNSAAILVPMGEPIPLHGSGPTTAL